MCCYRQQDGMITKILNGKSKLQSSMESVIPFVYFFFNNVDRLICTEHIWKVAREAIKCSL